MANWTLELADQPDMWTPNMRGHWAERAAAQSVWRQLSGWKAKAAGIPKLDRVTFDVTFLQADRRRRDPDNLFFVAKACLDGLRDVGVLDDDDWTRVARVSVGITPTEGDARWLLHISEASPLPATA